MEIITYLENPSEIQIPHFKHPIKSIYSNCQNSQSYPECNIYYSSDISIPDKILLSPVQKTGDQEQIKCYFLFGYQLRLKDWENIRKIYGNVQIKLKLYRGNQINEIASSIFSAKSFIKGQQYINDPRKTLIKRDEKSLQSFAHMYSVQINPLTQSQCKKIIYYLPIPSTNSATISLQSLKCRYFNYKFLQILSEYVSLQNASTSCYKDAAHHEFEAVVYSGKVSSFQVFIKLPNTNTVEGKLYSSNNQALQVWESFIQKLAPISMTDKHLLDQVDPLDFSQIKKQIRDYYLQEKRLRKSLTFQKIKIVQQIQSALQFLNLQQCYPQKLTYNAINSQMLKRIRSQNIENKASWIKQQNFILKNLQARITDLEQTKQKHKFVLLEQEKSNYQMSKLLRNEIKMIQQTIRYRQADKLNKKFDDSLHLKNKPQIGTKELQQQNKNVDVKKANIVSKKPNELLKNKQQLLQIQKQKILKFQMIKAQFQMQKQFVRRKQEYAKAAQDLFSYLTDC